jgi:hypothetical protein
MRKGHSDCYSMMLAVVGAGLFFLATGCFAQPQHRPSSGQEDSLKSFLQNYVGSSDDDKQTRYFSAFVDLNDDGTQEVVVYLTRDGWCGSGGCTTLVLALKSSSYRIVTKITITRPPIRI